MVFLVSFKRGDITESMYVTADNSHQAELFAGSFIPDIVCTSVLKVSGTECIQVRAGKKLRAYIITYSDLTKPGVKHEKAVIGDWSIVGFIMSGVVMSEKLRLFGVRLIAA